MSNFKVQLIPMASIRGGTYDTVASDRVIFEVTPTFTENRATTYAAVTPVHMPGSIQMYQNTGSRTFTVGAKLISRTSQEARTNKLYLQRLRGWLMPYFGSSTTLTSENRAKRESLNKTLNDRKGLKAGSTELKENERSISALKQVTGVELMGAPPDVLYLYAYSSSSNYTTGERSSSTANINRVPVVLQSLDITYPDDVDYIPVADSDTAISTSLEPFPVQISVSLSLVETHSPQEFEQFNLDAFKSGRLTNF